MSQKKKKSVRTRFMKIDSWVEKEDPKICQWRSGCYEMPNNLPMQIPCMSWVGNGLVGNDIFLNTKICQSQDLRKPHIINFVPYRKKWDFSSAFEVCGVLNHLIGSFSCLQDLFFQDLRAKFHQTLNVLVSRLKL